MEAGGFVFRSILLVLVSMSSVGTNLSKDFNNALQVLLTKSPNCTTAQLAAGIDCCYDCLGLGDFNYNSMYAVIFITGTAAMLIVGFLSDKFGNSVIILTVGCGFLGISLEALGSTIRHSPLFLPCIFVGSAFQGIGHVATLACRDRVIFTWFEDRVALGMGFTVAINRLSTLTVSCVAEVIREAVGLQWTLWLAASFVLFCLLCSIGASIMDLYGTRQLNLTETVKKEREAVKVTDVKKLSLGYWLLVGAHTARLSVDFTLQDNMTEFVHEKFGLSQQLSAIAGGSLRYIGFIAAPLTGLFLDWANKPFLSVFIITGLVVPSVALVGFSPITPLVTVPIAGSLCCVQYVAVFMAISRLVPKAYSGIGVSIAFFMSNACSSILHFATGAILGGEKSLPLSEKLSRWQIVMWMAVAVLIAAFGFATGSFIVSQRQATTEDEKPEFEYQELRQDTESQEKEK